MPSFDKIQQEISAMLDIPDEELTPEQHEAMDHYLDELAAQEAAKVDGFGQFIRLETKRAEDLRAEAQRLLNKAHTAEGRIAWLKYQYMEIMQEHGIKSVRGNIYGIGIRATPTVVTPTDLSLIPERYIKVKTAASPDKIAIKKALQAGEVIPGCELRDSYSLQIR